MSVDILRETAIALKQDWDLEMADTISELWKVKGYVK